MFMWRLTAITHKTRIQIMVMVLEMVWVAVLVFFTVLWVPPVAVEPVVVVATAASPMAGVLVATVLMDWFMISAELI